jgi:hypothetical protein
MQKRTAYDTAMLKLPACCEYAVEMCVCDTGETVDSIIAGVEHEMTLHEEDQDGCISAAEYKQCLRFLRALKKAER